MGLKTYLAPDKERIVNVFMLFLVGIILFYILNLLPFEAILAGKVYIAGLFFLVFCLIAYLFGCYISRSKKWIGGTVLYLLVIVILSILVMKGISSYNETTGRYCEVNSDCIWTCGMGSDSYNEMHVPFVSKQYAFHESCYLCPGVCENSRCEAQLICGRLA